MDTESFRRLQASKRLSSSLSELLNEQATIIDSLMDDGDEVHMT